MKSLFSTFYRSCVLPFFSLRKVLLSLLIVEGYFLLFYSNPLLYSKKYSIFEVTIFIGVDLFLWISLFFVVFLIFIIVPKLIFKKLTELKLVRFFYFLLIFVGLVFFIYLYLIDWLFFNINDSFFGITTFKIIFSRIILMQKHSLLTHPTETILLMSLSLVSSILIVRCLLNIWINNDDKPRPFYFIDKVLLAIYMSSALLALLGSMLNYFMNSAQKNRCSDALYKNVSPLTALMIDSARVRNLSLKAIKNGKLNIKHEPQIAMQDYIAGINRDTLKGYNVLLVLIESLRADQLLQFGGNKIVMPNLETLSNESFCFTNSYTQASHSDYSDPSPLSSHYPLRSIPYHVYPQKIHYPRVLIYDILKEFGYRTAIISSQNEYWGNLFYYLNKPSLDLYLHSENYQGDTYVPYNDQGFSRWVIGEKRAGKIDDRYTVQEAIKWIGQSDPSVPFFLYMNLQNSHSPFQLPEDFPKNFTKDVNLDFPISFAGFPPERADDVMKLYADTLSYVDFQLAKVFAYLKERNLWDNTIVIVSGDTGQAFYEHGFVAHGNNLFDETVKVPIIFKVPGHQGGIIDTLTEHIDIPPTLFHFLNVQNHPSFQGRNVFEKIDHQAPIFLVSHAHGLKYAIVKNKWKLIFDQLTNDTMLFNLEEDPLEKNNLNDTKQDIRDELSGLLKEWINAQIGYYRDSDKKNGFYPPYLSLKNLKQLQN